MSWSSSVISTVSSDTEPTVVINFDSAKYIFNAGENVGRSWLQSRHHWRKTRGLFLTSVDTQRGSGLPGLLMFLADAGQPQINVVAPQGLNHFIASMRGCVYRETMAVVTTEGDAAELSSTISTPSPLYKDENLAVYGIPVYEDSHVSSTIPIPDSAPAVEALLVDGKRKRESSPETSSKRVCNEEGQGQPTSESLKNIPVRGRMYWRDFSPANLQGLDAEAWRKLMITSMFPKEPTPVHNLNQASKKDKKKKKEQELSVERPADDSQGSPSKRPIRIPPHRERFLPHFSLPDGQSKPTLCYVCIGPKVRGKFNVAKAEEIGLKGHLRGKVANGQTVTLRVDDGKGGKIERTVKPEEFIGPTESPKVILILDVPSPAHIPSLTRTFSESPFYNKFRSQREEDCREYTVHGVYHICGEGVLEDLRYKEFMNGFPESAHHIISSKEHTPDTVAFTSVSYNQLRLNQLDPDMFPQPKFQLQERKSLADVAGLPLNTTSMRPNVLLDVRPPRAPCVEKKAEGYDRFHPIVTGSKLLELPNHTREAFKKAKVLADEEEKATTTVPKPGDDVVVVPLGTSSALPSKYRNVSSTLVHIPKWGNILLDCGEGTWGQLVRLYGDDPACSEGVWQALRELKCIFLSHMHGDHHIGLAKVLAMRQRLNPPPSEPLYVVGLRGVLLYLRELSEVEDLGVDQPDGTGVLTVLSDALSWKPPLPYRASALVDNEPFMDVNRSRQVASRMGASLGLNNFITVEVDHGARCYGCVIQHSDKWSIVFSADTRPSNDLVSAGQGATLLIHEATMGDDQVDMAHRKAHSTFGQAVDVGRRMKAENILLTHFSARYPKMPPPERNPAAPGVEGPTVGLAFDHARIRIGDMKRLRAYLPAIEQSFMDTAIDEDEPEEEVYQVDEPW